MGWLCCQLTFIGVLSLPVKPPKCAAPGKEDADV
jgi:hypothetical protein